jgi:hypothetical protein
MRTFVLAILAAVGALAISAAIARESDNCIATAGVDRPDFGLPHVAQAIARKSLGILVIGSASSQINGPDGTNVGYPARFEAALGATLPGVSVTVTTQVNPRDTAADMRTKLKRIIAESRPALVVWQTGTVDAIRGIEPDDFRMVLDDGVDMLEAAGIDVVLMNMQYSPRTEAMLAVGPYADTMRITALQREVVLFDRFAIMQRWNEGGVFDLYGTTRKIDVAQRVHDCLGRLLANTVVAGAKLTAPARKARANP